MEACTIIAKNYVAQARVLARSFEEHHPESRLSVLVIDDIAGYINPDDEPFRLLTPAQINCDVFDVMAARYDVIELSTAVKPWLLRSLLAEGAPAVTYLDPDIRIYDSLERLDELARAHGVVLTPHNTEPIPDDGHRPTQIDILIAGVYNLGYISVGAGEETDGLLKWWSDRLRRDCRVDPVYGYFVDQRWFDLAPGLVSDYAIVREPTYNVAYWNAHSRQVVGDPDSGYTVSERPLRFFHFSGFDPSEPHLLSRHQTRLTLSEHPVLERLCRDYALETIAQGYGETKRWPYGYGTLADGSAFSRLLRELFVIAYDAGRLSETPYARAGCEAFLAWLAERPDGAPPGVNRALAHIYGTRADVRNVFPSLTAGDLHAFLGWAATSSDPALELPRILKPEPAASVMSSAAASLGASSRAPADAALDAIPTPPGLWGVNVVGYFRSELGVGEAARLVVRALDAAGVPLLPVHGRTIPPNRTGHTFTHLGVADSRFPLNLICMNADALPEFAVQAGPGFFDGRYSIGLWFWEVSSFPERWLGSFGLVDEVWAPTDHVAAALSAVSPIPVVKVTIPVAVPPPMPRTRADLGLPEGFLFLFSFDYHSVFERKNPLAVVQAFAAAFAPGDGATLVIKCINEESDPANHERLSLAAAQHPDIHVRPGYVSPQEKDSMTASCDAYVSLHRSEGFGLTMAEAMYLGKPVIATGYSGNLDFMTAQNSLLVDYRLTTIPDTVPPYPPEGEWAEPDVAHAAKLMRRVFDDPPKAGHLGREAAADLRRTHSPVIAGQQMQRRLERVGQQPISPRLPPEALRGLAERVERGPTPAVQTAGGRTGTVARRILLRGLRPFTAYQAEVNTRLVSTANEFLRAHVAAQGLAADVARSEAELLAQVRRLTDASQAHAAAVGDRLSSVQQGLDGLAVLHDPMLGRIERLDSDVQRLQREARAIPYMEGEPFLTAVHPLAGIVEGYRAPPRGSLPGDTYRAFEDVFRGSEDLIRKRQARYLDLVENRGCVLDFGCGRGEFLDLLRDREIEYVGVDSDEGMVKRCREKGHTAVVHGDGLDYLAGIEDASLGVLFSAQVIEHLPPESLLRFLALARTKLASDGLLILETVNPHSPPALKAFWVDLTHQHPIFPEVALVLCRGAGFSEAFFFFPNGEGDVARDQFVQGEYAVVAGRALLSDPSAEDETSVTASSRRLGGGGRGEGSARPERAAT